MQTFELRCRIPQSLANKLTTFGESQGLTLRDALVVVLMAWEPAINAPLIVKKSPPQSDEQYPLIDPETLAALDD